MSDKVFLLGDKWQKRLLTKENNEMQFQKIIRMGSVFGGFPCVCLVDAKTVEIIGVQEEVDWC